MTGDLSTTDTLAEYARKRERIVYVANQSAHATGEMHRATREFVYAADAALARLRQDSSAAGTELRDALREALDAVVWMSGSPSFSPGGEAHEGWVKVRDRLDRLFALAADADTPKAEGVTLDRHEIGLAIDGVAKLVQPKSGDEYRPLLRKLQAAYKPVASVSSGADTTGADDE